MAVVFVTFKEVPLSSFVTALAFLPVLTFGIACRTLSDVPEFQEHPGNSAVVGAILFWEAKRNLKGPNEASNDGGGQSRVFSSHKWLCLLLVCTKLRHELCINPPHVPVLP
jgi:hypothetical protein